MRVTSEENNGIIVISLDGRIDATTTTLFEDACKKAFETGVPAVIVNMEKVEYISSAGLRGVLTMLKLGNGASVNLVFCSLGEMVSEVFRISGFNSVLTIYPTIKEALAALSV